MTNIVIQGHNAFIENVSQIINMGGPWIGDLHVDDQLVISECLVDNIVYDQNTDRLVFVKYHRNGRWQEDNYFTINILDLKNQTQKESLIHFAMIFVVKVYQDRIEIVEAFHAKDLSKRLIYEIAGSFVDITA